MSFFSKKKKDANAQNSPPPNQKAAFSPNSPPGMANGNGPSALANSHGPMSPPQGALNQQSTFGGPPSQLQQSAPASYNARASTASPAAHTLSPNNPSGIPNNIPPNSANPNSNTTANNIRGIMSPPSQPPSTNMPGLQQPQQANANPPTNQETARRSTAPTQIIYPWSQKPLHYLNVSLAPLTPPEFADPSHPNQRPALKEGISPPPFPRYGHSANALANGPSGDLYIFGGLVADKACNDLYIMRCQPNSTSIVNAARERGEANPPQVGSVSVGLVETKGEVPSPRLGHASVGVGNVLIIWGGDTNSSEEEEPSQPNDDALFLLNLSTREWTRVRTAGATPAGRYGHAAAMVGSRFYVFGGQSSNLAFLNDLWSFDLQRLKAGNAHWAQIQPNTAETNGLMPSQRTGHTVITHGDCIYIFGGTDGQYHYNDTWEFNTQTQRWTELQCTGYIPVPREGHSATLVDDVMYVFAGRGVDGRDLEDLAAFKITGPEGVARRWFMFQHMGPSPTGRSGHALASWQSKVFVLGGESYSANQTQYDPHMVHILDTSKIKYPQPKNQKQIAANSNEVDDPRRAASPTHQTYVQRGAPDPQRAPDAQRQLNTQPTSSRTVAPQNGPTPAQPASTRNSTVEPPFVAAQVRPKRDGDEIHVRSRQPENTPVARMSSPEQETARAPSPAPAPLAYPQSSGSQPGNANNSVATNVNGSHLQQRAVSPEPVARPPPASQPRQVTRSHSRNGSAGALAPWVLTALAAASQKGFVYNNQPADVAIPEAGSESQQQLRQALIAVRHEVAQTKAAFAEQLRAADAQLEATQASRLAAIQEATYYKAKSQAFESNQPVEVQRAEKDRVADLEQRLAAALAGQQNLQQQNAHLDANAAQTRDLHSSASAELRAATARAELAEQNHHNALQAATDWRKRHDEHSLLVQTQKGQIVGLTSTLAGLQATHNQNTSRLAQSEGSLQQYLTTLEQTQAAYQSASAQNAELHAQRAQAQEEMAAATQRAAALQVELDAKTAEAAQSVANADGLQRLLASAQEELASTRAMTHGGLEELLGTAKASHDGMRDLSNAHATQLDAMIKERDAHQLLYTEAQQHAQSASEAVAAAQQRHSAVERDLIALRTECANLRRQCEDTLQETVLLKSELAESRAAAQDSSKSAETADVKNSLLRALLVEHGIAEDGNSDGSPSLGSNQRDQLMNRIQTLENQLESRHHAQASEDQVDQLRQELERARSPSNASGRSPEERAAKAETELMALQDRHKGLVESHGKAVQYVKGTEKMLRRMKDEVNKHKQKSDELEAELATVRGGTDDNGKAEFDGMRAQVTDLLAFSEQSKLENKELQTRLQTVQTEFERTLHQHQQDASEKMSDLESEIDRLEASLQKTQGELDEAHALNSQLNNELQSALKRPSSIHSRDGSLSEAWPEASTRMQSDLKAAQNKSEWLKRENERLEARCKEAEHRVGLLLDHFERDPASETSSIDNQSRSSRVSADFEPTGPKRYSRRDSADSEELKTEFWEAPNGTVTNKQRNGV